jgi:D-beta-D-heptose 7-phosphate kinase/D-beta-D-heptose 1-phosphate adenosyltransferase
MPSNLIELVRQLADQPILLLGDLMLDRYIYGNADRLSQEAPVPVLHFHHEESALGGAGRVAAGITALGGKCRVVGLIGEDSAGAEVRRHLQDAGADVTPLLSTSRRPTIAKVRLVGLAQHRHPQQMMRLDYENSAPLESDLTAEVLQRMEQNLDWARVLCIEDYNKGLVTPEICQGAIAMARRRGIPVLIDPGPIADFSRYRGATALKPNRPEAARASQLPTATIEQCQAAAEWLQKHLELEAALVTLDKQGVYLAGREGQRHWIHGRERQVYDVTGAGDMFLATLSLCRAAGADWHEAATLANVAGGLECEKFGSIPITATEIVQELLMESRSHLGKVRDRESLLPELAQHRAAGKRIVFTNGCFDVLHVGHITYFKFAKEQGDILVVGVNSDASIQRLKGPKRPIVPEADRVRVLEGLESIDYVMVFDEDTPIPLLERLRPDVLVKGADYTKDQVVGGSLVEGWGGSIRLAPLIDGRSTTNVIQRILEAYGEAPHGTQS